MKYSLILLLFLALVSLYAKIDHRSSGPDLKNMVLVDISTFSMGLDSIKLANDIKRFDESASFFSQEYPTLRVTVPSFYIDKYEVTNAEFKKFIEANPRWAKAKISDSLQDGDYLKDWNGNNYPKLKANYPVVYVCWYAAKAYARWIGKRLPTEAEFESAAKGSNDKSAEFPWGNTDADSTKANYQQAHIGHPSPAGHYAPNDLGLYDMAGNVFEFCEDRWHPNEYADNAAFIKRMKSAYQPNLPKLFTIERNKVVIRGGSWSTPAVKIRTTYRISCMITSCLPDVGFRCVVDGPQKVPAKLPL